jgi:hypothetical protein
MIRRERSRRRRPPRPPPSKGNTRMASVSVYSYIHFSSPLLPHPRIASIFSYHASPPRFAGWRMKGEAETSRSLTRDYRSSPVALIKGQSGLFAIVRKPAYAFEQLLWISYCLFSVAATVDGGGGGRSSSSYHCMNWSMGGCVSLCILFQASGWLTERISMTKYPAYRAYRERVPLYVPGIFSLARTIAGITMEDREKGE